MLKIQPQSMFLASNATKDSLTLYLAQHLSNISTINIVTVTRRSVMVNYDSQVTCNTNVNTQEEADTLMILHALEVAASRGTFHIYTQDTDALCKLPQLGRNSSHTNGTLIQADGTLHPTCDKSSVIHLLEGLAKSDGTSSMGTLWLPS